MEFTRVLASPILNKHYEGLSGYLSCNAVVLVPGGTFSHRWSWHPGIIPDTPTELVWGEPGI